MNSNSRWLLLGLWLLATVAHAGTHHYYYTDPQGTVLAKADANGTIIATYDYAPYGTAVASMSSPSNGPGYTGHVNDPDTGLVYMQARYYDPAVGRFLSVDIVMFSAGDVFSISPYMYVHGNPVVLTDPAGLDPRGGKDMEICNGPVPCDSDSNISTVSLDKRVDQVFVNYHVYQNAAGGTAGAIFTEMPQELRTALIYALASPMGRAIAKAAIANGEKIGFVEIPNGKPLAFQFLPSSGLISYTLKLSEYKAQFANNPVLFDEVKDQTLDVIVMHELGHTWLGRGAFGINTPVSTQLNEFETIRRVENPYRQFYGLPLRTTSNGYNIPAPITQK